MKGIVRLLLEKQELLDQMNPEYVEDKIDFVLVSYMCELHKRGIPCNKQVLIHELTDAGEMAVVEALDEKLSEEFLFTAEYAIPLLRIEYNKRTLFSILSEAQRMLRVNSPEEVEQYILDGLKKVHNEQKPKSTKEAFAVAMTQLNKIYSGEIDSVWETGHTQHDENIGFSGRMLAMVAAQRKHGKTRYTVDKVMRIITRRPTVHVDWFTFEMHASEMIICIIAWLTGINTDVIKGKLRKPTEEERAAILAAKSIVESLNITWHDEKMGIRSIRKNVDKSAKDAKELLVVIDNLGLIRDDKNLGDLQHDNDIATELVDMRDKTGALIFIIHHLSKENESHFNKDNFFEPDTKHVRGSNKLADSLNLLILLHRVSVYEKLEASFSPEEWKLAQNRMLVKVPITRDGSPSRIKTTIDLSTCRFTELPPGNG